MVDMATLQAFSYVIGSLGVLMAAVYYVLNLRGGDQKQDLCQLDHVVMSEVFSEPELVIVEIDKVYRDKGVSRAIF